MPSCSGLGSIKRGGGDAGSGGAPSGDTPRALVRASLASTGGGGSFSFGGGVGTAAVTFCCIAGDHPLGAGCICGCDIPKGAAAG